MSEKNNLSPEEEAKWNTSYQSATKAMDDCDKPIFMTGEMPGLIIESDIEALGVSSLVIDKGATVAKW
jgi:hypothetical protein